MMPPPGNGFPGQPQQPPIVDPGNTLLTQTPAQLVTGFVQTPNGQLSVLTIRTPTTTLTVMLNGQDIKTWAKALGVMASNSSGNGLVTGKPGPLGQFNP